MNPIYKFILTVGTAEDVICHPIYKDDLAKEFERESNQQFFRAKLSGKLTFQGDDYALINAAAFDTKFYVEIQISYDGGAAWSSYWYGSFFKTDCDFDDDAQTVEVTPTVVDQYTNVLAGLEKEYNLIDLLPEIVPVTLDKRPMIQVYVPGQSVIGCFLSGMWWVQECTPVSSESTLINHHYFAKNTTARVLEITHTGAPTLPDVAMVRNPGDDYYFDFESGGYRFMCYYQSGAVVWHINNIDDPAIAWERRTSPGPTMPYNIRLSPVSGSSATGDVLLYVYDIDVYARYVLDVDMIGSTPTHPLPSDDIVEDNRNYSRAVGYAVSDVIYFSDLLTSTPTQWGIYQPNEYYARPDLPLVPEVYPVARNGWGRISIWFAFSSIDWAAEQAGRASFTLNDAYPLSSVISVLLAKIAPGITHQGTTVYSQFLYGANPLTGVEQTLLITPKSNIISSGYDQPAQKATITLKTVLDMLRDCFRCYWYIDTSGRFCVEHVSYFMNGGSYFGHPTFGINLTAQRVTRNGKSWAFARNQYKFEKPEMTARYQFGWMDDVTQLFEGYPIDIISGYVNPDNIEEISVSQFTSDIDYILLNPGAISKDGFVLMAAVESSGEYVLPYYTVNIDGVSHVLQNAYVSFAYLQRFYAYDMPAWNYEINGEAMRAMGVKKLKTQELRFPALTDPNLLQFVKTNLGNGMIQKLSVNLSSRSANATLMYDTE